MNHLLETPVGLDSTIKGIQQDLYGLLRKKWYGELCGYGRVYKNKRNGVDVPEWYIGNGEYEEVFYNDRYAGNFFFIEDTSHDTGDEFVFSTKVKCVFMVNLDQILPDNQRQDAQAQKDAVETLRMFEDGRYSITGIEKGIDTVFKGFDTSLIRFEDIHPSHCFAVVLKVNYYLISGI